MCMEVFFQGTVTKSVYIYIFVFVFLCVVLGMRQVECLSFGRSGYVRLMAAKCIQTKRCVTLTQRSKVFVGSNLAEIPRFENAGKYNESITVYIQLHNFFFTKACLIFKWPRNPSIGLCSNNSPVLRAFQPFLIWFLCGVLQFNRSTDMNSLCVYRT